MSHLCHRGKPHSPNPRTSSHFPIPTGDRRILYDSAQRKGFRRLDGPSVSGRLSPGPSLQFSLGPDSCRDPGDPDCGGPSVSVGRSGPVTDGLGSGSPFSPAGGRRVTPGRFWPTWNLKEHRFPQENQTKKLGKIIIPHPPLFSKNIFHGAIGRQSTCNQCAGESTNSRNQRILFTDLVCSVH